MDSAADPIATRQCARGKQDCREDNAFTDASDLAQAYAADRTGALDFTFPQDVRKAAQAWAVAKQGRPIFRPPYYLDFSVSPMADTKFP